MQFCDHLFLYLTQRLWTVSTTCTHANLAFRGCMINYGTRKSKWRHMTPRAVLRFSVNHGRRWHASNKRRPWRQRQSRLEAAGSREHWGSDAGNKRWRHMSPVWQLTDCRYIFRVFTATCTRNLLWSKNEWPGSPFWHVCRCFFFKTKCYPE